MEIELSQKTIDAIAHKTALILARKMREKKEDTPKMVSVREAASILGITPVRMRQIAGRFPHIKQGDSKQGRILFLRSGLLENY
jgi:predicted transcriptional regulator of viral defense system